ncbi:MAG: hypothetical protein RLN72_12610 [Henriciella sp.]
MLKRVIPAGLLAISALPAMAQTAGTLSYTCNLDGVAGQLVATYEVIGNSGITYGPNGGISGVIGTGDSTIYYQGQLTSPVASYVFTGENQFADFTDLQTQARFRVQFIQQGNQLLMIANPFGPGPTQYLCQANRAPTNLTHTSPTCPCPPPAPQCAKSRMREGRF